MDTRAPASASGRTSPPVPWPSPAPSLAVTPAQAAARPGAGQPGSRLARRSAHRRADAQPELRRLRRLRPEHRHGPRAATPSAATAATVTEIQNALDDPRRRLHHSRSAAPTCTRADSPSSRVRRRPRRRTDELRGATWSRSSRRASPSTSSDRRAHRGHRVHAWRPVRRRRGQRARPGLRRARAASRRLEGARSRDFLLEQQCSSGYFRLNSPRARPPPASPASTAPTPRTPTPPPSPCLRSPRSCRRGRGCRHRQGEVVADPAAALRRLLRWRHSTEGSNANSTGLAPGRWVTPRPSRQAATWLRAHQATAADAGDDLATETGAVAYDDAALAAGRTDGITDAASDQWRRATAQAAPGHRVVLRRPDAGAQPDRAHRLLQARAAVLALRATGAEPGTVLCVRRAGTPVRGIARPADSAAPSRSRPGHGTRTYTVRTPSVTPTTRCQGARRQDADRDPRTGQGEALRAGHRRRARARRR